MLYGDDRYWSFAAPSSYLKSTTAIRKNSGRLREDSDPAVSAMLILAVSMFPFIARTLAEPVLGVKYDEDGIEFLNHQITQLLKRGISK